MLRSRVISLAAITALTISGCNGTGATRASTAITVKIVAFNDFHGNINPPSSRSRVVDPTRPDRFLEIPTGGIEYMSSVVAALKAQNDLNVVVAAGDLIGGSPLTSAYFHDEPTIDLLSAMGLEFSAVGNHEFDAGKAELWRMQHGGCAQDAEHGRSCVHGRFKGASFEYLSANVLEQKTGNTLFPPYAVKRFTLPGGIKFAIAFIGLVTKSTPNLVVSSGVAGLRFTDEADAANALVPQLQAQGIKAIVVLIHEGGTTARTNDDNCEDFAGRIKEIADRLDSEIDLIVSGHTHGRYICNYGHRLITNAGAEGHFVTDIDLTIDTLTRDVRDVRARQVPVVNASGVNPLPGVYAAPEKDSRLSPLVAFYNERSAPLSERKVGAILRDVTRQPTDAGESALGDLIADAQLAATRGEDHGGAQLALLNPGGIRADLHADRQYVTYSDLFAVHPFGNRLVTLSLTGEELKAVLEQQWLGKNTRLQVSQGFSYTWDASAPVGEKVIAESMRLDGVPIEPDTRYRVTVNEFLAAGGDGFTLLANKPPLARDVSDIQALERYIQEHSPVDAPATRRIELVSTPAKSQISQ